ncbi:MAG: U32 family peptidase [Candidatus ainarchaeum sp.]|nr:U32 family peptidase [Candidatus ainarchaeum sp.]
MIFLIIINWFFMKNKKIELLVGVADFKGAIAAVKNGANAVYFGVKGFNMRDLGTNFEKKELKKLMRYLHENNLKGYLALNTIVFPEELKKVDSILLASKKVGVDAVIASDFGVMLLVKKHKLELHVSTQCSVSNELALKQFKKIGAKRIVLARELNFSQVKKMVIFAKKIGLEVEAFVHGAMCIAVSGRCFMSHDIFGRSANRGECLQVCRRTFHVDSKQLEEENCNYNSLKEATAFFLDGSPNSFEKKSLKISGNTILSAKDMKTIEILDKVLATRIISLKIEGRTKPTDYIAITTKCYRQAIDSIKNNSFSKKKIDFWNKELSKVYNRKFSTGFWEKTPSKKEFTDIEGSAQTQKRVNVGRITKFYAKINVAEIKLFDKIQIGDSIIIEGNTTFLEQELSSMQIHHKELKVAFKGQNVGIKVNERVRVNDLVFKIVKNKK